MGRAAASSQVLHQYTSWYRADLKTKEKFIIVEMAEKNLFLYTDVPFKLENLPHQGRQPTYTLLGEGSVTTFDIRLIGGGGRQPIITAVHFLNE